VLRLRERWRRFHGWWLLLAAGSVSAVAGVLASSLPTLAGSVLVAAIGGLAGALSVRAERSIERGSPVGAVSPAGAGRVQRVRELANPLAVGVHPALSPTSGEDAVPPFVLRDRSLDVVEALRVSRFVLVVGESTAGKTRMAYEAMRSCLGGHVFIRPRSRRELPAALDRAGQYRRSVVWLDDLQLYLGAGGLVAEMITPLLAAPRRHIVVLATMRAHERARYSPRQDAGLPDDERHAFRRAGEVLALAREVRVDRLWSRTERDRAAGVDDGRITRALEQADRFGVAQYLAAGPQLFREWQDAGGSAPEGRPRGAALVAAAVDARRAGYHDPLPIDFLRRLHEVYLADAAGRHVRLDTWEDALAWATQPLHSTSSLLLPSGPGRYVAFDYLGDALDEYPHPPDLPGPAWEALIEYVPAADVIEVAWSAFLRGSPLVAERALRTAVESGHYEAALDFAAMMHDAERVDDVLAWLERAIEGATESGSPRERLLALREQLAWWLGGRWAGGGDPGKARRVALEVVEESARLLGEEHELTLSSRLTLARQVGELGDPEAALALAKKVAETAARLPDIERRIGTSARFEIAVWTRWAGDPRAAVGLWQTLVADTVSAGEADILDTLGNIAATVEEIADPAFDSAVTGWLEHLTDEALRREDLRADLALRLLQTLAWWVGGREDGPGDHVRAREIAQWAIDTGTEALGPNHEDVLMARLVLAHQEGRLGASERAHSISQETAETFARIHGETHRHTQDAREEAALWARSTR
jgi:eukaryotic-like serine/threonine-protein kinase